MINNNTGEVTIGGAKVKSTDSLVANGVVHILEDVIEPQLSNINVLEAAQLEPQLKGFVDLIEDNAA